MNIVQVQFSIGDRARGDQIASELLHERLVACVQTLDPVTSRYWWQGSLNEVREWLFVCKTTRDRCAEVFELVRLRHPYDVPEIVEYELTGDEPYAAWVAAETQRPPLGAGDG
ncbi:MAG: periplasmic divalent cation tolerance protein [Actinomycetota bacterium]|jgi:periplasmic divalent cation tolerance protein|nr:periplasmic divalent cation tolerance protein [Actinomycetota bacterium]